MIAPEDVPTDIQGKENNLNIEKSIDITLTKFSSTPISQYPLPNNILEARNYNQSSNQYSHSSASIVPPLGLDQNNFSQYATQSSQSNTARSDPILSPQMSSRVSIAPAIYPEDLSSMSIHDFYGRFWEITFKLFIGVCSQYTSCHDCLTIVEGNANMFV